MADLEPNVITPRDLEGYYRSIEVPFYVAWKSITRRDDPTGIFAVGFLMCLVPVIPLTLSLLTRALYGNPTLVVWRLRFAPSSFWFWWPTLTTVSFLFLLAMGRSQGRLTAYRIRLLSPQQLRFAYCYGTLDEIRRYRSSREPRHIREAEMYLNKLDTAMMRASTLDLAEGAYPYHYWQSDAWVGKWKHGEGPSVGISLKLPNWYRLKPDTEEIVKAFPRFVLVREYVADGKDLPDMESVLTDFAVYLYTEIPEVPGAAARPALEKAGTNALLRFARKVNALAPYKRQPLSLKANTGAPHYIAAFAKSITAFLTHENALATFFAWYVLSFLFVVVLLLLALRLFPAVRMSDTLMAMVISTPFVVAAAALVLTTRSHSSSSD